MYNHGADESKAKDAVSASNGPRPMRGENEEKHDKLIKSESHAASHRCKYPEFRCF